MEWAILITAAFTLAAAIVFGIWTVALARRSDRRETERADVHWRVTRVGATDLRS